MSVSTVAVSGSGGSITTIDRGTSVAREQGSGGQVSSEAISVVGVILLLSLIGVLVLLVAIVVVASVVAAEGVVAVAGKVVVLLFRLVVIEGTVVRMSNWVASEGGAISVVVNSGVVVITLSSLVVLVIEVWVGAAIGVSGATRSTEAGVMSDHAGNIVVVILGLVLSPGVWVGTIGVWVTISVRVAIAITVAAVEVVIILAWSSASSGCSTTIGVLVVRTVSVRVATRISVRLASPASVDGVVDKVVILLSAVLLSIEWVAIGVRVGTIAIWGVATISIAIATVEVVVLISLSLVVLVSPVVRVRSVSVRVAVVAISVADEIIVIITFSLVVLTTPVVWVSTVGVRVAIAVVATDKVVVVLVLSNFHAEAHLHLHLVVLRLLVVLVVVVVDTGGSVVRAMGKVWVSVVVGIVFLLLVLRNLDTIGLLSLLLGGILLLISLLGLLLLGSILLLRLGNRVEKLVGTIVRIGVVVDRSIVVTVGREAEAWVVRGIWVRGIIWVRTISEATISVVGSVWVTELLVDLLMETGVAVQWSAIRVGSIDVRGTVAISASDEAILLLFGADKSDDKGGNVRSHPKDWFGLLLKK